MRKTKKAIASLAIAGMVLSMAPMSVFGATTDTTRLGGAGRVETAIQIAAQGWTASDSVIVVPADDANIVDALAAAPLAGQLNAPILVTYKGALDPQVQAEIVKLGAKNVYAVGALSADTVASLKAISGVTVTPLQGADRTETAAKVAAQLTGVKGSFVVAYDGKADALSAASFAAANDYSIVIANPDGTIPASETVVAPTYTVGGQVTVAGATALAGADRYATNNEVLNGLTFSYDKVYVANGQTLVDALAGAPLAAQTNSPIVLGDAVDVATGANDNLTSTSQVIALGGTGAVSDSVLNQVSYKAPAVFDVESVEAQNLIQIKVELSNDNYYDKDALKDEANYEFEAEVAGNDGTDIAIAEAVLDGTTLILNLDEAVDNQTVAELTIDDAVTGEELVFDDIEFFDTDIPTVEAVEVIGEDTVKVSFSEPINFYAADAKKSDDPAPTALNALEDEFEFELDGKTFSVEKIEPTENDTEVNVTVYGSFTEGELTVDVGNGLEDYAGFNVTAETFNIDVVVDEEAPVVTGYKDAEKDEVTLIFDNTVRLTSDAENEDFYHTNENDSAASVEVDDNEVTLNFSEANELPDGTAYVYVKSGAIEDLWGNENDLVKIKVEVDVDEDAPTINEVEFDGTQIVVTFSEEVDEDSANDEDNYVVLNTSEDNEEVGIRTAVVASELNDDDESVVTLTLRDTSDLEEGDVYEITVSGVEDTAGNKMEEYSIELEYTDDSAPVVQGVFVDTSDAPEYTLYVEFNEELATEGDYAATDLYKYELKIGTEVYNLGEVAADDDDNITADLDLVDGNKTVELTVDTNGEFTINPADATNTLSFGRIADIDGNYTNLSTTEDIQALATRVINISKVEATAKDTIEVTFDGNLDSFELEDFYVSLGSLGTTTTLDIETLDVVDANEIIITLDEKLPANSDGYYLNTAAATETENAFGAKLATGDTMEIVDKIAPAVSKVNNEDTDYTFAANVADPELGTEDNVQTVHATFDGTTSTITIVFNEELAVGYMNASLVEVNGGDSDVVSATSSGNTVTITVSDELFKGDSVTIEVVEDTNGNRTYDLDLSIEYLVD